eukprot:scaffold961_cov122-Cylindrotheca_fusiformis.AAC.5
MQKHRRILLLVLLIVSISVYPCIYLPTLSDDIIQDPRPQTKSEPPFWSHTDRVNGSHLGIRLFGRKIDNIRIVGERHSGTTFLTRYLKSCFPTRTVSDVLVNGKHWFQPSPQYVKAMARKHGEPGLAPTLLHDIDAPTWWNIAQSQDPKSFFNTTLVISLFRNPYQWVEAMRRVPHHWPNHVELLPKNKSTLTELNYTRQKENGKLRKLGAKAIEGYKGAIGEKHSRLLERRRGRRLDGSIIQKSFVTAEALDWQDFVRQPLSLVNFEEKDTGVLCQKGFSFGTISPCDKDHSYVPEKVRHIPLSFLRNLPFEVDEVVYELDIDGMAFQDIMQLRAAKINNFLNLVHDWSLAGFVAVRYDDIIGDKIGTFVGDIESALQVESSCPNIKPFYRKSYTLPNEFTAWISDRADWRVESRVGFDLERGNETCQMGKC